MGDTCDSWRTYQIRKESGGNNSEGISKKNGAFTSNCCPMGKQSEKSQNGDFGKNSTSLGN